MSKDAEPESRLGFCVLFGGRIVGQGEVIQRQVRKKPKLSVNGSDKESLRPQTNITCHMLTKISAASRILSRDTCREALLHLMNI
jgi:hypothetical protein